MRLWFALVLVALAATHAEAGMLCLDAKDYRAAVSDLETFARSKLDAVETTSEVCLRVSFADDKYASIRPRMEKACAAILERDGGKAALCVELAARLGKTELGGVKLADAVLAWALDPWLWDGSSQGLFVLGKLGDPRGAARIIEVWRAELPRAKKREKQSNAMMAWAGWRKDAAAALGLVGSRDDIAFLEEQAAATKDRHVRAACRDAVAAITKRSVATPPPTGTIAP